ncbi:MAG: hypothetical protein WB799_08885 [Candidatus Sulfotelmatobacter sp.]
MKWIIAIAGLLLLTGPLNAQTYAARTDLNNQPYPTTIPCPGLSCTGGGALNGANFSLTPTDFNTKIIRVTDASYSAFVGNSKSFAIDASAEVNPWNTTSNRFWVVTGGGGYVVHIWNSSTMQATPMYGGVEMGTPTVAPWWSFTQQYILYSVESSTGTHNASIYSYDFSSTSVMPTRQLVVDLTTCAPAMAGLGVPAAPNFSVSADDQTFLTTLGTNTTTGNIYVVVWNRSLGCRLYVTNTGAITGSYGGSPTGTINVDDHYWLHNAHISMDGNWVRVDIGQCTAGSCESPPADQSNDVYYWQINSLTVNVVRFSSTVAAGGHQAAGFTHAVNGGQINNTDPNMVVAYRPFSNVNTVTDLPVGLNAPTCGGCSTHYAWVNDKPGDTTPFLNTAIVPGTFTPTAPWQSEITAYATDTSGTVWRFAHNFCTGQSQFFTAEYCIGSVSQDGNWFIWSSDWDGMLGNTDGVTASCTIGTNCRADVFIVPLSTGTGGAGPPPPPTNLQVKTK